MIWFVVAIALLVVLVYIRVDILIAGPLVAIFLAVTSGLNPVQALTEGYLPTFGGFCSSFFLVFGSSAIFARVMQDTGMAASIARTIGKKCGPKYAVLVVFFTSVLLTYGGVSLFVVVFVLYPIALQLFREANITRAMIPGAIAAGAFTFASSCLPGAAQAAPLVAAGYLDTTIMVMPLLGILCGGFMCVLIVLYLNWALKKSRKDKLEFEDDPETTALIEKFNNIELPNFWLSLLPMLMVIVTLNVFKLPVYICMAIGVAISFAFGWKNVDNKLATLNAGVGGAVLALLNTAAANGFGGVAKMTPAFAELCDILTQSNSIPPLLSVGLATTLIAGACGSGTGGLGVALGTLAPVYIDMGVSPGLIHRVSLIACGGLDSLPHNGAVVTCLTSCGVSHKDGYKHMGWTTVVIPLVTMLFCIIVGSLGFVF